MSESKKLGPKRDNTCLEKTQMHSRHEVHDRVNPSHPPLGGTVNIEKCICSSHPCGHPHVPLAGKEETESCTLTVLEQSYVVLEKSITILSTVLEFFLLPTHV